MVHLPCEEAKHNACLVGAGKRRGLDSDWRGVFQLDTAALDVVLQLLPKDPKGQFVAIDLACPYWENLRGRVFNLPSTQFAPWFRGNLQR